MRAAIVVILLLPGLAGCTADEPTDDAPPASTTTSPATTTSPSNATPPATKTSTAASGTSAPEAEPPWWETAPPGPLLFIHGLWLSPRSLDGQQEDTTAKVEERLAAYGLPADLVHVAYHACERGLGWDITDYGTLASRATACGPGHDGNTSISQIGHHLSWAIYQEYTVRNACVDLLGVSMGGLIAAAALMLEHAVPEPPCVRHVVTMGTPFGGTDIVGCDLLQCQEMRPASSFLASISRPARVAGSVEALLIGSVHDDVVSDASATNASGHKLTYLHAARVEHGGPEGYLQKIGDGLSVRDGAGTRGWVAAPLVHAVDWIQS